MAKKTPAQQSKNAVPTNDLLHFHRIASGRHLNVGALIANAFASPAHDNSGRSSKTTK